MRGIQVLEILLANYRNFLNLGFWEILKEIASEIIRSDMAIVIRVSLEVIDFWGFPSILKLSEPFDTFLELLPVVIYDAEMKDDILYTSLWFDAVNFLELGSMVDSIVEYDLLFKLEMYALHPSKPIYIDEALGIFLYDICS